MLTGSADVTVLAATAPAVSGYFAEPLVLEDVVLFQCVLEMRNGAREAVLPPALHPTIPPTLSVQVWQAGASPWGAFRMAVTRVSCRGGVRARGFTTAAIATTGAAVDGLRSQLGYPARLGEIDFLSSYSRVDVSVVEQARSGLRLCAVDPVPLGPDDAQYTGTLNLARVPEGVRLVQAEFQMAPQRVERLKARLIDFDPACWGDERLDPYHVVAASVASGTVTFPPLRFLLRPDELAFTGTETIGADR
ncbi:MAG: hypothetical protein RIC56_10740 [Pseudomonadales bacterium]